MNRSEIMFFCVGMLLMVWAVCEVSAIPKHRGMAITLVEADASR